MDESYHCSLNESFNHEIESKTKKQFKKTCFHSRKIFSYFDSSRSSDNSFLERHMTDCLSCQQEAQKVLKIQRLIKSNIPKPLVLKEFEVQFSNEIRDIFKDFKRHTLKEIPTFKESVKEFFNFLSF